MMRPVRTCEMVGSVEGLPLSLRMNIPPGLPPEERHPPAPSTWMEVQPLPVPLLGTLRSNVPLTTWADAADTRASGTHARNRARIMIKLLNLERDRAVAGASEAGCVRKHNSRVVNTPR